MSECSNADRTHQVYEIWSGSECLYVGQTCNLHNRLHREHDINSWSRPVTDVRITDWPNQGAALLHEKERIMAERPLMNQHHNTEGKLSVMRALTAELFPGNLAEYVQQGLATGRSWRQLRDEVNAKLPHGLTVSHETLRTWFGRAAA